MYVSLYLSLNSVYWIDKKYIWMNNCVKNLVGRGYFDGNWFKIGWIWIWKNILSLILLRVWDLFMNLWVIIDIIFFYFVSEIF